MSNSVSGASNAGYVNRADSLSKAEKKQPVEVIKQEIKEAISVVADSAKELTKTPEGKAIVGGLALTPFVPIIGPAIAMGGLAAAALKKAFQGIKQHAPEKEVAKKEVSDVAKKAALVGAAAAAGAAAVVAVPALGVAAAAVGAAKLAKDSIKNK